MGLVSANNLIVNRSQPSITGPYPWHRWCDDSRPEVALIIGDGFSRGFLNAIGIADRLRSNVNRHFDLPQDVHYRPLKKDHFSRSPFWDLEKWPLTIAKWKELSAQTGSDFYKGMALREFNSDRKRGAWSFRTSSLEYELRCYLWHLFRSFDLEINEYLASQLIIERSRTPEWKSSMHQWGWLNLLALLVAETKLTAISFNYDLVFERVILGHRVIGASGAIPWISFVEEPPFAVDDHPADFFHLIKIHGSIDHELTVGAYGFDGIGLCPWKIDFQVSSDMIAGIHTRRAVVPDKFPLIPDLVPPGRQGDDICNPYSRVFDLSATAISRADLVIFCGLSAAEPDTEEVRALVAKAKPTALVVQVGLEAYGDRQNPLAKLIAERQIANTRFCPRNRRPVLGPGGTNSVQAELEGPSSLGARLVCHSRHTNRCGG